MSETVLDRIRNGAADADDSPPEFASPQRPEPEELLASRRYMDTIYQREKRRRVMIERRIRELELRHGAEADAILDDPARCRELLAEALPKLARYLGPLTADRSRRFLLRSEVLKALERRES